MVKVRVQFLKQGEDKVHTFENIESLKQLKEEFQNICEVPPIYQAFFTRKGNEVSECDFNSDLKQEFETEKQEDKHKDQYEHKAHCQHHHQHTHEHNHSCPHKQNAQETLKKESSETLLNEDPEVMDLIFKIHGLDGGSCCECGACEMKCRLFCIYCGCDGNCAMSQCCCCICRGCTIL
eukprot:TRINITY_DN7013_c0_g1_i1.p1 TRINITY_DN7013_c0_g1~~TRINITY_DN7013_c0_g1_i1.p1  ORF type:complete len:192 (-),score=37.59 TRINITY_DN7013_c0_g1_i1:84-620(-)